VYELLSALHPSQKTDDRLRMMRLVTAKGPPNKAETRNTFIVV
jgi:hypothetical protein